MVKAGGRRERSIGDRRSQIEALYRRYASGVGGYVLARTADPELAEAITARVFTLVVRRFEQCRGSHAAWLWSIVRNELARHFRSRKRHGELHDRLIDGADRPDARAQQTETQQRLHEALKQLPEEEHEIIYMKFFQDMANKEIAAALGMTANHVGVKAYRTLKQLREMMESEDPDGVKSDDAMRGLTGNPGSGGAGGAGGTGGAGETGGTGDNTKPGAGEGGELGLGLEGAG